eukprot:jgi/Botrbrau1/13330/Bobra.0334s0007.1
MQKATACVIIAVVLAAPFVLILLAVDNQEVVPVWRLPPQRLLEIAQRQPQLLWRSNFGRYLQGRLGHSKGSHELWSPGSPGGELHPPYNWTEAWQGLQTVGLSAWEAGKVASVALAKESWDRASAVRAWAEEGWQSRGLGDLTAHAKFAARLATDSLEAGRASLGRGWDQIFNSLSLLQERGSAQWQGLLEGWHARVSSMRASLPPLWSPGRARRAWGTASRQWGEALLGGSAGLGRARDAALTVLGTGLAAVQDFWDTFKPGGKLHPAAFLQLGGHIYLELTLGIIIVALLAFPSKAKPEEPLTEEEIDALVEEWQPEPLFQASSAGNPLVDPPVISSIMGPEVIANGKKVLNMGSYDFLGISGNAKIMDDCTATITKYGVGSCGPRGFYGTIDVHLHLEDRLAKFMGTEESIIYSYDLATVPSVLPAFANAKDLIVCDAGVSYAIQNGAALSRARVLYFRHNDIADLKAVLDAVAEEDRLPRNRKKPLNRRFIVVEGLYQRWGDVAPLQEIFVLKKQYKYRLVVDEDPIVGGAGPHWPRRLPASWLAARGRRDRVCLPWPRNWRRRGASARGNREIVDHQRLSGLGYCYSASLPPYLATAAIGALDVLEQEGPNLVRRLQANAAFLRDLLREVIGMTVVGNSTLSPVVHMMLDDEMAGTWPPGASRGTSSRALQTRPSQKHRLLICPSQHTPLDLADSQPSLRLVVTAKHSVEDIRLAVDSLTAACRTVLRLAPVETGPVTPSPERDTPRRKSTYSITRW